MRDIKSELVDVAKHNIVILQNIPQHKSLVKVNKLLVLLVLSLMLAIFVLGFLILPANDLLDNFKTTQNPSLANYSMQNPNMSAEIDSLRGQLVGLVSDSIEGKLRVLEKSILNGSDAVALGTIQNIRNEVKVLRSYSKPEKKELKNVSSEMLLNEVFRLKNLIYLTLTSCGLLIAAIGGFWVRGHFQLNHHDFTHSSKPEKRENQ